jgi:hypothetical protein
MASIKCITYNTKISNFERYFLNKESEQKITESFKFYRDKEILIRVPDPETNPAVVTLTEED